MRKDEAVANQKASESQALKEECESDLAEAIPALEAALAALNTLKVHSTNLVILCLVRDFYFFQFQSRIKLTVNKFLQALWKLHTCYKSSIDPSVS